MKSLIIYILILIPCLSVSGQNSDTKYAMPLPEVLKQIEMRFNITLSDPDKLTEGDTLTYAMWRFRVSLDETLKNILLPFDLTYEKKSENKYKIKKYQYHRLTVEEGKEKLNYLAGFYNDKQSWEARRSELKACILKALLLDTMPAKPASKPILRNKRKLDGYTIENFALETLPGYYVCGSIYRPAKIKGKIPVILCPMGHFNRGRYGDDEQKLCASFARMGAIAVSYDLLGYGESLLQFKPEDHRRSLTQTIQTLNTIRIFDYILSLPEADTQRVAITGASGGGSQTMLISAIDNRIKVSVPVVMLSCIHYGGCPCESGQPIHLCGNGTNNVEIAAMFAPKPQLVVSDGGDWTANVPVLEYPFLKRIYGFYNDTSNLENKHFPNGHHNYNFSKREVVYDFMVKYLDLNIAAIQNKKGEIDESFCTVEEPKEMYVFGDHGEFLPSNAIKGFDELTRVFYQTKSKK